MYRRVIRNLSRKQRAFEINACIIFDTNIKPVKLIKETLKLKRHYDEPKLFHVLEVLKRIYYTNNNEKCDSILWIQYNIFMQRMNYCHFNSRNLFIFN